MHRAFDLARQSFYRDIQIGLFPGREDEPNAGISASTLTNSKATLEPPAHSIGPSPYVSLEIVAALTL